MWRGNNFDWANFEVITNWRDDIPLLCRSLSFLPTLVHICVSKSVQSKLFPFSNSLPIHLTNSIFLLSRRNIIFPDSNGLPNWYLSLEREPQLDRGHPEANVPQVVRAPHHRLLVQQFVRDRSFRFHKSLVLETSLLPTQQLIWIGTLKIYIRINF